MSDHVGFKFTAEDLTLSIDELRERVIEPAMAEFHHQVDRDIVQRAFWNAWLDRFLRGETVKLGPVAA